MREFRLFRSGMPVPVPAEHPPAFGWFMREPPPDTPLLRSNRKDESRARRRNPMVVSPLGLPYARRRVPTLGPSSSKPITPPNGLSPGEGPPSKSCLELGDRRIWGLHREHCPPRPGGVAFRALARCKDVIPPGLLFPAEALAAANPENFRGRRKST